jgi:hypothetical protein
MNWKVWAPKTQHDSTTAARALSPHLPPSPAARRRPPQAADDLAGAMGSLSIRRGAGLAADAPLRGVPLPRGTHTRFDDAGVPKQSPLRTKLCGVPVARGDHKRFDD